MLQKREPGAVRMEKFPGQDPPKKTNSKVSKGRNTTEHHTHVDHPVFWGVFLYFFFRYINVYRCITTGGKFGMYHLSDKNKCIFSV